ncbi:SHC-transforming protein 4 [Pteropus alecto]|uniref:SHC-transforming protein 4 n=1 Tax=Pteropus alecto TaxID=9402 RepID=L5K3W2_PTEAL|nr:SHC-transforming protein 4 [Pteropus alecto]
MRSPVGPQIIWKLLIFEKVVPLEITKKHLDVFIILFLFLRKDKGKAEGMPEQRILILLLVYVYIARKINDEVSFGKRKLDGGGTQNSLKNNLSLRESFLWQKESFVVKGNAGQLVYLSTCPADLFHFLLVFSLGKLKNAYWDEYTALTPLIKHELEAISRLCEAVPGANGAIKRRKPPVKFLSTVLGKSNLQFSGMNIKLTISTYSLTLMNLDNQQIIANHHMQSISFASGGDPDTTDYVAYVAKDPVNQRACHILECRNGMAQDVITTIGQAFELRFKQYLKNSSLNTSCESEEVHIDGHAEERDHEYYNEIPGKQPPAGGVSDVRIKVQAAEQMAYCPIRCEKLCYLPGNSKCSSVYENCLEQSRAIDLPTSFLSSVEAVCQLTGNAHEREVQYQRDTSLMKHTCRVDLFDDPCYINTQALQSTLGSARNQSSDHSLGSPWHREKAPETVQPGAMAQPASSHSLPHIKQQLRNEECYHGKLSRKAAESLLVKDGDFLVRESATSPGQYVLSGLQGGQAKHLLLVDPEGKVRTKDHVFDNVGHLIRYHMDNSLPIISSGSEVSLKQPVRKDNNPGLLHSNK